MDFFDIFLNRKVYKSRVEKNYRDSLTSFQDLLGDGNKEMSWLFYFHMRRYLFLLNNNPEVAVSKKYVRSRKKYYPIIKWIGPKMLGCTQVYEDRKVILEETSDITAVDLPDEPVIFVANHGFRDDVLATVLAAKRHALIFWGSLPLFYNSIDGFSSSLVGQIMVNRRSQASRKASVEKAVKALRDGTSIIIFPEGCWNKTSEKPLLHLWGGVYDIAVRSGCKIVPIVHYVRDPEIVSKKNKIHTLIDYPMSIVEMSRYESLCYLRDRMSSICFKMMERYGKSTRKEELKEGADSFAEWSKLVKERLKVVTWYDSDIEDHSEYVPKGVISETEAFGFLKHMKPTGNNAFLYRNNERWWVED